MARWTGLLSNFLIICLPCSGMESGADQGMRWKRPSLPWLAAPTAGARLANAFLGQRHTLRGGGVQGGIGDDGSSGKDFAPVQEGPAMPSSSEEVEEDWYTREKKGSSTGWEKLKAYYEGVEQSIGQNEVDNIGIEEYGPHTVGPDAGKDWRGRGAFKWYTVPWVERPLIGTLEMPDGDIVELREGDLPNRQPYGIDDDDIPRRPPRAEKKNLTTYEEEYAGQDLRKLDHWAARINSDAKEKMPPGGYPIPKTVTFSDDEDTSSDHSSSDLYEELRNTAFKAHGRAALPIVTQLDKLTNYTGTEPPWVQQPDVRGELTPRFDANGIFDGIVPMEFDELDCDVHTLSEEQLNMKLWQYATDGRSNATKHIIHAGADVNAVSEFTHTALHYAARKGWTPVISVLLHHGADVHVTNQVGMTPLHYAAYYNHTPAVWQLLRAGADMNATSTFEFAPWDYAEDFEYRNMQILFRAYSRNASDFWDLLYGDDFRESHHPMTFNSTPTQATEKYGDFSDEEENPDDQNLS